MSFYKDIEVSKKYGVSSATPRKWVKKAEEGRVDLKLIKVKNKFYIIKNEHNDIILKKLTENSKIYKSKADFKEVSPSEKFYEIFNEYEVAEIINSLEVGREIIDKWVYRDQGAKLWDDYYKEETNSGLYSIGKITVDLLKSSLPFWKYILTEEKINIIDLGPGNSFPLRDFIADIKTSKTILNYIGVDISQSILDISEDNISSWFPDIKYTGEVHDLENCDLTKLYISNKKNNSVSNLSFHLGATYPNHKERLKVLMNIKRCMGINDYLVIGIPTLHRDTMVETEHMASEDTNYHDSIIPKMMGIDANFCNFVAGFDEKNNRNAKYMILDKDYRIKFNYGDIQRTVDLNKGEKILMWRHYLFTDDVIRKDLEFCGLKSFFKVYDKSERHCLLICKPINA